MTLRGDNVIQETERRLCGVVKWFDPSKGFGFIVADGTQDDILLHANVLRNFGQSSVADNARIEFIAQGTTKGVQATVVLSIAPPETTSASLADFENVDDAEVAQLPLEAARVKWFDKAKRFGFANIWGSSEDVFEHVEILRRSGLADLQAGEAVAIRVISGKRGKMAAEVCSWESVSRD
jgi:CspA family cold shock protein